MQCCAARPQYYVHLTLVVPDVDVGVHQGLVNVNSLLRIDHKHLTQQVPSLEEGRL